MFARKVKEDVDNGKKFSRCVQRLRLIDEANRWRKDQRGECYDLISSHLLEVGNVIARILFCSYQVVLNTQKFNLEK